MPTYGVIFECTATVMTDASPETVYTTWCNTGELADFDDIEVEDGVVSMMVGIYYDDIKAEDKEDAENAAIREAKKVFATWNKTEFVAEMTDITTEVDTVEYEED